MSLKFLNESLSGFTNSLYHKHRAIDFKAKMPFVKFRLEITPFQVPTTKTWVRVFYNLRLAGQMHCEAIWLVM